MSTRPPRPAALLLVGAALLLCACGSDTSEAAGRADDGTGSGDTTATVAPPGPAPVSRLPARDELVDAQEVTWRSAAAAGARTLELVVTAGPAACFGARTRVVESATEVRVRVEVGRLPEAADRECIAVALEQVVAAELAAPLGDRAVVPLA